MTPLLHILLSSVCMVLPTSEIKDLKCEHLKTPLGIDTSAPRLAWKHSEGMERQATYRIVAGTDSSEVASGRGADWDTGEVLSDAMMTRYEGKPLESFTRYWWKVYATGTNGERAESEATWFETGMMSHRDWKGLWITDCYDTELRPAAIFRKEFEIKCLPEAARAYVAVGGLFELEINGVKAGDHRLDPMYTKFDRRTLYVTHDVTDLLKKGGNVIEITLGNGWYNHQARGVWDFERAPWRARPRFCMDLRICYPDGTEETVCTDETWQTALSSITYNNIYTAEQQDGRIRPENWRGALPTSAPSGMIVSQQCVPIRDVDTLEAISVRKLAERRWLYDFGRNIAGTTELRIKGEAGDRFRTIHAERLTPDGHADQSNIDYFYHGDREGEPYQADIFTLAGTGGTETFRQKFGYKGFRYVEVIQEEGEEADMGSDALRAFFMHSDVEPRGSISSSDELLDKIWEACNASYLSNLYGYPTDCPQREKNGWTGDAHIAIETALYNFDGITVYEKWMNDHKDAQISSGVLPAIIPTGGWGHQWGNGVDWTSTVVLIPWNIYLFYGDDTLLRRMYDNIKAYVNYLDRRWPSGLTDWGLGDWIPIKSRADKELTSSIYFHTDAFLTSRIAGILGHKEDEAHYGALAEKIRNAINDKFLNREEGIYASGLQTELCMPLFWNIVPEDMKAKVAERLAQRVEADGGLDVGLLGSKAILGALSDNGYSDLAYSLASRDTFPSWGYWIVNGATTFYENWIIEGCNDMSMNHIMFGEIGAWMYRNLGGIRPDPASPGFRNVILAPEAVKGLKHFEARHDSPYGEIRSSWKRKGNKVTYHFHIPANATAEIRLKGSKVVSKEIRLTSEGDGSWRTSVPHGDYTVTVRD